ncbi:kinesin protein KIN-14N [Trifolium repens]|nr:kinesin protein KIN-14N [Trifolium repens]
MDNSGSKSDEVMLLIFVKETGALGINKLRNSMDKKRKHLFNTGENLSNLQFIGEVEELSVKHRIVDDKIREALSKILDIKGSIRMFCRTRPNHLTEKRRNSEPVSAGSERIQIKLGGTRKDFEFDKVFPQETSQC